MGTALRLLTLLLFATHALASDGITGEPICSPSALASVERELAAATAELAAVRIEAAAAASDTV